MLGSKGGISAENVVESTVVFSGTEGIVTDKPLSFFLQRYAEAYRCELDHFTTAVSSGLAPLMGAKEGIRVLALADAAVESARTGARGKFNAIDREFLTRRIEKPSSRS
jgi:myo-inositol 2-dehydrogenase/D-chiro-inositol 1-dehydrogenase